MKSGVHGWCIGDLQMSHQSLATHTPPSVCAAILAWGVNGTRNIISTWHSARGGADDVSSSLQSRRQVCLSVCLSVCVCASQVIPRDL